MCTVGELGYHEAVGAGLYRPLGTVTWTSAGAPHARGVPEGRWYVLEHDEVLDREPEPGSGPLPNVRRSLSFLERAWEEVGSPTVR